jgi:hypothetical protein
LILATDPFPRWFYHRQAIQDLLALKQEGLIEDYTKEFEAVQFQVSMFNAGLDDLFFTSHFISAPKDDIPTSTPTSALWKERQLRDFTKANDLCYYYGEKFVPRHLQKCTKRVKP